MPLPPPVVLLPLALIAAGVCLIGAALRLHRRSLQRARRRPLEAVGGYRLLSPIGRGGMGEVFRAWHERLERPAAVKLLASPRSLDEETRAHALDDFRREARTTARLRSPHTVQLYDFGSTDDGRLYYAMEYLGGLDLEHLALHFGAQPPARVIHLLRQVCASLAEAHAVGLVHSDVKSANLQLLIQGGEFDFVKVLDFGLVKHRTTPWPDVSKTVRGTPGYLAPEVVRALPSADERADLYAVGCVAYELLTRRLVFEGGSDVEVMRAHVQRRPTPPSALAPHRVPLGLEQLVLALLEKLPGRRPPSAKVVGDVLARLAIAHPWTQADAEAWWRAHVPEEVHRALAPISVRLPRTSQPARTVSDRLRATN